MSRCKRSPDDGILAGGQQVLEHLILKGEGGTGVYTVYLDNFEVVTVADVAGNIEMKSGSTLAFTASGSDPDGMQLLFALHREKLPLEMQTSLFERLKSEPDSFHRNFIAAALSAAPEDIRNNALNYVKAQFGTEKNQENRQNQLLQIASSL